MASISNVGKILDPRRKAYVEWKIPNFFSLSREADIYFKSPTFYFFNEKWYIRMYPNGFRRDFTAGWIDLILCSHSSGCSVLITLGFKYQEIDLVSKGPKFRTFDYKENTHGFIKICKRNYLSELMREISPEGTLVVYCDAIAYCSTAFKNAASQTKVDSTAVVCRDFQDLLQSKRKSDVTIEVCGHIFQAHKLILESRSPVFSTMFNHNMRENSDSIVKISDCDPDAFHNFLQYVYTGKLEKCSWDNVMHLFDIADKFCIKELKEQCAEYITEELSVDNACDILVLADKHNKIKLKEAAKTLLIKNMTTFKTTDKWKSFVAQNPLLAVEILTKFVPDKSDDSEEDDDSMHVDNF